MIKTMQEGLGGIRDVIIDSAQKQYNKTHARAVVPLRRAQAINQFIGQSPRFGIEAVSIMLIGGLAYWLVGQPGGLGKGIPILGALVFGAQRMLPALQMIYVSWSAIQGNSAVLRDVVRFLEQPVNEDKSSFDFLLPFENEIVLENLHFSYNRKEPEIIKNVSLKIIKGSKVGFIGATGSGKSTLIDIIMGLLEPTKGSILIDGITLDNYSKATWQRNIAHVPQSIFLSDSSIKENIAFGVPVEKIDTVKLKSAAEQAQIGSLIETWPNAYNTLVGERGVRLSGGQLQRIGIARALYKSASVIVFDEATSSLDKKTEDLMMNTIDGFDKNLTILIITHRPDTLRNCDQIVEMENSKVKRIGSYNEIISNSIIADL